jgi:hypothetical protein
MIEYIINEKDNKFYINKKIPNDSRYPRWYNNKYAAPFIEIEFEITNSLDEAKQIIIKDKEDIINETQTNTVPRR